MKDEITVSSIYIVVFLSNVCVFSSYKPYILPLTAVVQFTVRIDLNILENNH